MKVKVMAVHTFLAFHCCWPFPSCADQLLLDDGMYLECRVLEERSDEILIEVQGMQLGLPRSRVKKLEKATQADNALVRGDELLAEGKYGEAVVSYVKALQDKPEEARAKIAAVENRVPTLSLEEQASYFRVQSKAEDLSQEQRSSVKTRLTQILLKRAAEAIEHQEISKANAWLEEAWTVSPEDRDVALAYARLLLSQDRNDPRIGAIVKPCVYSNPDDLEVLEIFAAQAVDSDPWPVLKLVYPNGQLLPRVAESGKMRSILADVLLACFNSKAYPFDAPFGRISCYERLMDLKPRTSPLPLLLYKAEHNPTSAQAHYDLGHYYHTYEDYGKAIDALEYSIRLRYDEQAVQLLQSSKESFEGTELPKARGYLEEKLPEEAQEICEAVLEKVPESVSAYSFLEEVRRLSRCEYCQGTGKDICASCDGTGEIILYEPVTYIGPPLSNGQLERVRRIRREYGPGPVLILEQERIGIDSARRQLKKMAEDYDKYEWAFDRACPDCQGTGLLGQECPYCKGQGVLKSAYPRPISVDVSQVRRLLRESSYDQ